MEKGDPTVSLDLIVKSLLAMGASERLKGTHTFLRGGHDYWLKKSSAVIWERKIEGF